jgi:hypothetical protein
MKFSCSNIVLFVRFLEFLILPILIQGYFAPLFNRQKINTATNIKRDIVLPHFSPDYFWGLNRVAFSLLPLAPGPRRKTLFEEIVKDQVWTLDQVQGIVNVNVPVRSTIIKLSQGGLFVYNPVAPTNECIRYIKQLENQHGPVKYIVLGSLGLEHKSLAASFSQYFPKSQVFLQPGQWSFPINLPDSFLGFPFGKRLQAIPFNKSEAPWMEDFDYEVLGPLRFKSVGGFGETAFFHRKTGTLLVTDTIVRVPNNPPAILTEDPRAILFHSRDDMLDDVEDTEVARQRGWRRMALFSLVFFPGGIAVKGFLETFKLLPLVSTTAKLLGRGAIPLSGGLYPWRWEKAEVKNFKALQGGLLVAPILRELILNREPEAVLAWADKISQSWSIKRIIPCHFENNILASSKDFRKAFQFLEAKPKSSLSPQPLDEDSALLRAASEQLTRFGVVAPPKV